MTYYTDSKQIKDSICVLSNKPQIKHGRYFVFYNKPKKIPFSSYTNLWIKTEGYYFNNLKDSDWKEYNDPLKPGCRLIKEGHYKKGKRVGIWKTLKDKCVYERFDYDKNKKLFPIFKIKDPKYPAEALDKNLEGKVQLKVKYNDDYSIKSIESLIPVDSIFIKPMIEIANLKSNLLKKYAIEFTDTVIRIEIFTMDYRLK
jgi:hypothetical protein